MAHYKSMFDATDMLFAHDLGGREVTVEIAKVYAGDLVGEKGRKTRKPFLVFKGKTGEKKLAVNKTNGKTIAKLYGTDTNDWVGKLVTLFPTTTDFGGETVDCIRIKPSVPTRGTASAAPATTQAPSDGGLTDEEKAELLRLEREESTRG